MQVTTSSSHDQQVSLDISQVSGMHLVAKSPLAGLSLTVCLAIASMPPTPPLTVKTRLKAAGFFDLRTVPEIAD